MFCGSSTGDHPRYAGAAEQLGREMVRRGIGLVFGGGGVGLMGARELAHRALPDLRVVNSMHDRKATMATLADAFVALPGGFGTFEEFCEVITWTQLGVHRKSCGLFNVYGFYDPLIEQFDRAVAEGFIKRGNRQIVVAHADPAALLDALAVPPAPAEAAWISGPEET